jgi:hypothetical protein
MRLTTVALGAALAGAGAVAPARAAVNESEFPPHSVRELIALCSAGKDDAMMTGAVNYCHGFVEGAVIVEDAHAAQRRGRKLFCLPTPAPAHSAAMADFAVWANSESARLDQPALDGLFLYLAIKYPCGKQK